MRFLAVLATVLLAACQPQAENKPQPVSMTAEATGHYCQMIVLDHEGPKAQAHVAGLDHPLWFSQVRDVIAYLRMPEETDEVRAVYVSDMGKASSWAEPGPDNWTDAQIAHYVIGSERRGGMGAPEAVPFSAKAQAEAFVAAHGGQIVSLADIPDAYVLAPVDVTPTGATEAGKDEGEASR